MDFFKFESPPNAKLSLRELRGMFERCETRLDIKPLLNASSLTCNYVASLRFNEDEGNIAMRRCVSLMKQFAHDEDVVNDASKVMAFLCGQCTRPDTSIFVEFCASKHPTPPRFQLHLPEFAKADVGFRIWGASLLISRLIVDEEMIKVRGKTVVELGAASGLCSMAALHCVGAAKVYITDFNQACLHSAQQNIANCNGTMAKVLFLDWTLDPGTFDIEWKDSIVIGAAVVYEERHAEEICALLDLLFTKFYVHEALIAVHLAHSGHDAFVARSKQMKQFSRCEIFHVRDEIGSDQVAAFHFSNVK